MIKYEGNDDSLGIRERNPGLDNYNIGYNAGIYGFDNNIAISNRVEKNAPAIIQKRVTKGYTFYDIKCNNLTVGQLSAYSSIRQTMENKGINQLRGFFVSDIFYWAYQDTLKADERRLRDYEKNPTKYKKSIEFYAPKWCEEAKNQGYIFIVSISGYGNPIC